MPTTHRLACFRDDVVFIIYLYQRYLYPVDKSRVNEFGESFEAEPPAVVNGPESKKTKWIEDIKVLLIYEGGFFSPDPMRKTFVIFDNFHNAPPAPPQRQVHLHFMGQFTELGPEKNFALIFNVLPDVKLY